MIRPQGFQAFAGEDWLSAQRVEDDAAHLTVGALETLARAGATAGFRKPTTS